MHNPNANGKKIDMLIAVDINQPDLQDWWSRKGFERLNWWDEDANVLQLATINNYYFKGCNEETVFVLPMQLVKN